METYQIIAIIIILIVIILFFQLKSEKQNLVIVNKDGEKISITVEIADNDAKRIKGLMFRNSLPENEGMLFVFNDEQIRNFWMANTTIPLDALHIDTQGRVVDIISMEPCRSFNCPTYLGKVPAKYVLEVNAGFAEKYGISTNVSTVKFD